MSTIYLVRHAAHDLLGSVLTGRMPGVRLGALGVQQCEGLARRFARDRVAGVYTSPLERARETAEPIAARHDLEVEVLETATEVDYGGWSGLEFSTLDADPRWEEWNRSKATYRPPGGETLLDVQWRGVSAIETIVRAHPDDRAVLVSHGDVIKAILAYYLGLAVEGIGRFEISPASISTLAVGTWGAKVHAINEVVEP